MSRIRLRILASALLSYLLNLFVVYFFVWLIWGTLAVKTGVPSVGYDVVCLIALLLGVAGYLWTFLVNTMLQVNDESRATEYIAKLISASKTQLKEGTNGQ